MLKGLEISEVLLSELNEEFRIDAQFFKKQYLLEEQFIRNFNRISIGACAFITDGPHGYHIVDEQSDIAMLTARCAKEWFANRELADTISLLTHQSSMRSSLDVNDLILSTRGTVGLCAIVELETLTANIDQDVARICFNNDAPIQSHFALAYINSKFGQDWVQRNSTGMVQQGLSLAKVRAFPIPVLSISLQNRVTDIVQQASYVRKQNKNLLKKAETTLLQALGLSNWQAPEPLSYIRSSRDAFAAGRLDAEYFHPAKTAALAILQSHTHFILGDFFDSIRELWQANELGASVKNYDLGDALSPFLDPDKLPTDVESIGSTKKVIQAGDLVVSRLRSYLKEIAVVLPTNDEIKMVASSEFIVLRPRTEDFSVEVLMVYLRSILPQIVFKWSQDGSNHPRFNEKELLALPVPHINENSQINIKTAIQSSRHAKQRATQLLEAAKRAVEIAIEDSEQAALVYLEGQMQDVTVDDHQNQY